MNRSAVAFIVASMSLALLAAPASAGSGIGKGSPPAKAPGPEEAPGDAAPASVDQNNAGSQLEQSTGGTPESATEASAEQTTSGTVTAVTDSGFTCRCAGTSQDFSTAPTSVFRKNGTTAAFSDLTRRASVSVQFHTEGGAAVADTVDIWQ